MVLLHHNPEEKPPGGTRLRCGAVAARAGDDVAVEAAGAEAAGAEATEAEAEVFSVLTLALMLELSFALSLPFVTDVSFTPFVVVPSPDFTRAGVVLTDSGSTNNDDCI